MKNYELFLILRSKKDEAEAQKSIREIETVLNKYGAKLLKNHGGANQKLAYPINKRNDSYQATLEIQSEEKDIAELRKQVSLLEDVVRFNIFTLTA
jgi:small subunit ribosomal protein S6